MRKRGQITSGPANNGAKEESRRSTPSDDTVAYVGSAKTDTEETLCFYERFGSSIVTARRAQVLVPHSGKHWAVLILSSQRLDELSQALCFIALEVEGQANLQEVASHWELVGDDAGSSLLGRLSLG